MQPELGLIEGFYGPLWSWEERKRVVSCLAPHGFSFYLYAPKADESLRNHWRTPLDPVQMTALADFSAFCRQAGVRFGVGLSPIGAIEAFDSTTQQQLSDRLRALDEIGVQDLAILFDDVRIDLPDLARRQVALTHWARKRTAADRMILCPSYYADDPALDRMFGPRPVGYLEHLGEQLDPAIEIFWAGEEVCSREISTGHLQELTRRLGRRPFLWDNYPVNDGPRMCEHLHLRGFTGRSGPIGDHVAAHGINLALQPMLSCIPALTLPRRYDAPAHYQYLQATRQAMADVLGDNLARMVMEDLPLLEDVGLAALATGLAHLKQRYAPIDHPAAREIVNWLDGAYAVAENAPPIP